MIGTKKLPTAQPDECLRGRAERRHVVAHPIKPHEEDNDGRDVNGDRCQPEHARQSKCEKTRKVIRYLLIFSERLHV